MQKPAEQHIWIIQPDFTSILPNNCMFTMQLPSGGCTSFEIYLSNGTSAGVTYSRKMQFSHITPPFLFLAATSSLSFWFNPQLGFHFSPRHVWKASKAAPSVFLFKKLPCGYDSVGASKGCKTYSLKVNLVYSHDIFFLFSVFCCCYAESHFVYFRFMLEFISKSWEWS